MTSSLSSGGTGAEAIPLKQLVRAISPIILAEASDHVDDLEGTTLWYPEPMFDFGERLVLLAGLVGAAVYVEALLSPNGVQNRDRLLEDHLRIILFGRGYDRGLACAVLQRMCRCPLPGYDGLFGDDRQITDFIGSRQSRPSNFLRSHLGRSLDGDLAGMLRQLPVLAALKFCEDGTVALRDMPLEVRPFIAWDRSRLLPMRRLARDANGVTGTYPPLAHAERAVLRRLLPTVVGRLERLGELLAVAPLANSDGLDDVWPESVVPLLADTHPMMTRLASTMFDETQVDTRVTLWTKHHFPRDRDGAERAKRAAKDIVFVTNAIIQECLNSDPITVMQEYLCIETSDQDKLLEQLVSDDTLLKKLQARIDREVDTVEEKLRALYCAESKKALTDHVDKYRARLVAQEVVRLFGFQVIDTYADDSLESHIRHIRIFREALAHRGDSIDAIQLNAGLWEAGKLTESLLKVLVTFYLALALYKKDEPDGLSTTALSELKKQQQPILKLGLGGLFGQVKKLPTNQDLAQRLLALTGRQEFWPEGSEEEPFAGLQRFIDWRDNFAHGHTPKPEGLELLDGLLNFLEWLRNPDQSAKMSELRVFPALMSLSVITTNNCGVSSVKYSLSYRSDLSKDRNEESKDNNITLYTQQRVPVGAGTFFGLPFAGKAVSNLWVDPVLIPVSSLRGL